MTASTVESFFAVDYVRGSGDVLYSADKGGDENDHIYLLSANGKTTDLTPDPMEKANFAGWSKMDRKTMYYLSNKRDPRMFDLYKMTAGAWKPVMLYKNDAGYQVAALSWDEKTVALVQSITTNENRLFLRDLVQDLRLELDTAYLLLQEQPFSLVYEPQCEQKRCPDLAVTFTTRLTFMVEITRLRSVLLPDQTFTSSTGVEPLADTICSKLGQLLPGQSNVLIVGVDSLHLIQGDLQAVMLRIQQRAERSDPSLWQRYRLKDRADFFRHYQRLSEVLVRGLHLQADAPVVEWVNPQAKAPLPGKVRTAFHRSHSIEL